jgi:hypothetical protein
VAPFGDVVLAGGCGTLRSGDRGNSWSLVDSISPTCFAVQGATVFAGSDSAGVRFSSDAGISWAAVNDGLSDLHITSLAIAGGNLYAGTAESGVWRRSLSDFATAVHEVPRALEIFALEPNFPNPFNPSTTIRYSLPREAYVSIIITNSLGEVVAHLFRGSAAAGVHQLEWSPGMAPSGAYSCRLLADGRSFTQRMLLVK